MKGIKIIILLLLFSSCNTPIFTPEEDFLTPFELSEGKENTSYEQAIAFYKKLATNYGTLSLKTMGNTDSNIPLYLVVFNSDGVFDFNRIKKNKLVILIANGMESNAGEGIDATMQLMRNLAQKQISIPENVVVATIPVMNYLEQIEKEPFFSKHPNTFVDRNLAEDFIKNKSLNTRSFIDIFHQLNPQIFIDTRSLAGKDTSKAIFYQTTVPERLGKIKYYIKDSFLPQLKDSLAHIKVKQGDSLYELHKKFLPYPKDTEPTVSSSVGYVSLWNTIGLYVATQGNSPYKDRVEEMYNVLKYIVSLANSHRQLIENLQNLEAQEILQQKKYVLSYEASKSDSLQIDSLLKDIYTTKETVTIPEAYIVPQLLKDVIENLERNNVEMVPFDKDSLVSVSSYSFKMIKDSLQFTDNAQIKQKLKLRKQKVAIRKGDFLISTSQKSRRYLLETLEPNASEGFMDAVMLPLLYSKKDTTWTYPIFKIENKY